jgi:hypothetical protein
MPLLMALDLHTCSVELNVLQAWDVARVNRCKPEETPWPKRQGDCTTTYNSQYNLKEVPLSRTQAYCELRSKTLDKNDYKTKGNSSYKVRFHFLLWATEFWRA